MTSAAATAFSLPLPPRISLNGRPIKVEWPNRRLDGRPPFSLYRNVREEKRKKVQILDPRKLLNRAAWIFPAALT